MSSYMAEPRKEFEKWIAETHAVHAPTDYRLGLLAMSVELVGLIKNLERLPVVDAREELISALHTLLVENGLVDQAYEVYDRLAEWRRPTIVADEHVAERVRSADVDRPPSPVVSPRASAHAGRRGAPSPEDKLRVQQQVHQSLRTSAALWGVEIGESEDESEPSA